MRLRDDREGVRRGEGRDDVAPLPARETGTHASAVVAHRRSVLVAVRLDTQVRAPTGALW